MIVCVISLCNTGGTGYIVTSTGTCTFYLMRHVTQSCHTCSKHMHYVNTLYKETASAITVTEGHFNAVTLNAQANNDSFSSN